MIDRSIQKASGTVTWALFVAAIVFELIATQVGIYSSHIAAVFAVCGFVGSAMVQFILRIQQMESEALAEFKELKYIKFSKLKIRLTKLAQKNNHS